MKVNSVSATELSDAQQGLQETSTQKRMWWIVCTAVTIAIWFNILFWVALAASLVFKAEWAMTIRVVATSVSTGLAVLVWCKLNHSKLLTYYILVMGLLSLVTYGIVGQTWWIVAPMAWLFLGGLVGRNLPSVRHAQVELKRVLDEQTNVDDEVGLAENGLRMLQEEAEERNRNVTQGMMGSGKYWYLENKKK